MSRVARLGTFIVSTLVLLAVGVFVIGNKQYFFSPAHQLKGLFSNVVGLDAGDDVWVDGVHSGTVGDIELPHEPGDTISVVMNMDRSTREIVKQDSVASMETEELLGNQYVAVSSGSAATGNVRNGDTIASNPSLDVADPPTKTDGILDSSQEAIENPTWAAANFNPITATTGGGEGTAGALVNGNGKELYSAVPQTTTATRDTTAQAQLGIGDSQEGMEALEHNAMNVRSTNVNYGDGPETSAFDTVNSLSSSLAGFGNSPIINGSQPLSESAGKLEDIKGADYHIFDVTPYMDNNGDVVAINGNGSGDPLAPDSGFSSNVNRRVDVTVTGGLTDGGDSGNMQIVSGDPIDPPPSPTPVPEPSSLLLLATGLLGLGCFLKRRTA